MFVSVFRHKIIFAIKNEKERKGEKKGRKGNVNYQQIKETENVLRVISVSMKTYRILKSNTENN